MSLSFLVGATESRNRVEELFIWKISDEMKLSVPEEKSFSELVRRLNRRRAENSESLQSVLQKIASAKTAKEKGKFFQEHRKLVKAYNAISLEEIDQVEKLFGVERAAQYFVLKNDLTNRLKSVLANSEKSEEKTDQMQPPQIIEQK